jgi:hypothetical protein
MTDIKGVAMIRHESIRAFQKEASKYLNGEDIVIIEDAKTKKEKGVYMPYALFELFEKEMKAAIRRDVARSFTESFDGSGAPFED